MSIFDFFKPNRETDSIQKKELPKAAVKGFGKQATYVWSPHLTAYSNLLQEADAAIKADSLIRQAVTRLTEIALRQGWSVFTHNEKIEQHIKQRMFEIQIVSNQSWYLLFKSLFSNLIKYGNAYLVYNRNKDNSTGKPYRYFGTPINPISSVASLDPRCVRIVVNQIGRPVSYEYDTINPFPAAVLTRKDEDLVIEAANSTVTQEGVTVFQPKDVLHIKYDGDNDVFGRPYYIEALEDLLMLRKLEDQFDSMIDTGMFNAVVYYVGNDNNPPQNGEFEEILNTLEYNPAEGVIIIPGHHDIKFLQAQNIVQLISSLEYFKQRFFSGIGFSSVGMGESGAANRATASETNKAIYEKVKFFQDTLSGYIALFFEHLILDGGFALSKVRHEEFPLLQFPDPEVDLNIKRENHAIYKYEHSAITQSEMRTAINHSPVSGKNEKGMYIYKVKVPLMEYKQQEAPDAGNTGGSPNEE